MSGTEHPAIARTGVPVQHVEEHVEEHAPQHDGPSTLHTGSPSSDTLVSVNIHEPVRYDTRGFVHELDRGLYPPVQQIETHPVVENNHQYDEPFEHNRSFSQDTLVSVNDHEPMEHDRYPPIHQSTHQYEGSSQQPTETLTQDSYRSRPVLRRPVPTSERRDQYAPIQQTDLQPHDPYEKNSLRKDRGLTPFVSYGLALLFVFLASLGFWIQSRRKPIFFSKNNTIWMLQNPKTMTMLWTSIAAFLAWCTLWLHACTVSLMARRLILRGAKISTIECKRSFHIYFPDLNY